MYDAQQLAAMRTHPDRAGLIATILAAHDALPYPTMQSSEVMARVRSGRIEVLFDPVLPAVGGLTPGENPVILGGRGILGNPIVHPDQIASLVLSLVHEGVHHLDVDAGRCRVGGAAALDEEFLTELHAYAAEVELAQANGLDHLLGAEFRGIRYFDEVVNAVLTTNQTLIAQLATQPHIEPVVVRCVAALVRGIPQRP